MLGLFLVASACKKYDEGAYVSLRSKKSRVAGTWEIVFYETYDNIVYSDTNYRVFTMTKDGEFEEKYRLHGQLIKHDGKWHFGNQRETLILKYDDEDSTRTVSYKILELRHRSLTLEDIDETRILFTHK